MFAIMEIVSWQIIYIVTIASVLFYLGLVILGYASEGPQYQIKFAFAEPIRSTERLLVGIGVRCLSVFFRAVGVVFDPLFETSAEIGEWLTSLGSAETQARYRSRFI